MNAESLPDDRLTQAIRLVEGHLRLNTNGRKYISSHTNKQLSRLGDTVSVALVKLLYPSALLDTLNLEAVLSTLKIAFAYPDLIERPEDRQPQVALLLLDYLRANIAEPSLANRVLDTQAFLKLRLKSHSPDE
jgi:hypothetical protein